MRRILILSAIGIFSFLSFAREVKVAYFDSEKLRSEWGEWKDAQAKFDQDVAQWQQQAQKMEEDLNALMEEFQRQQLLLSEDKRQEKQMLIQQKQQEYQDFLSSIFGEGGTASKRNAELTAPLYARINKTLAAIADKEGYSVVFDALSSGIAYVDPTLDITEELVKQLKTGQ